jgi:hypothetical protein
MSGRSSSAQAKFGLALFVVVALTAAIGVAPAAAQDPGDAGLLSLRQGVGAREAAMGSAGVASSTGAAALFWNPANNVFAGFETEVLLQHHRYLGLFSHEAAAVAHRVGRGVLGFQFMGFYSDEIPRYDDEAVGVGRGTFSPYDVAFGLSYAHPLGDRFAVGAAAKLVYEKIDIYSDTGFAFDFFVSHKAVIEGLVLAASATNFGSQMMLREDPFDLPAAIRLGAAWTPADLAGGKVTLAGDLVLPNDSGERGHVGAEYRMLPEFVLRAGTRLKYDNQGLTAGAGFRTGRLGIDYAFEESKVEGFDDGHKFSLSLTW